jgi:hypothetical protein
MTRKGIKPYQRRRADIKTILHWGQLKLMLSEIDFLTPFAGSGAVVIYAGAAPGVHTIFLSEMFPSLTFHLYDPTPFSIPQTHRVKIHVQLFLAKTAKKVANYYRKRYPGKKLLFISDIRRRPPTEKMVEGDMVMQREWVEIMKPDCWMLKFRLPWTDHSKYEYLKGTITAQSFAPPTSTETRLIGTTTDIVRYDPRVYENLMYTHNLTRSNFYASPLGTTTLESHDVCNCFDCVSFVRSIQCYLKAMGAKYGRADIIACLTEVRRACGTGTILSRTNKYWRKLEKIRAPK